MVVKGSLEIGDIKELTISRGLNVAHDMLMRSCGIKMLRDLVVGGKWR